MIERSPAVAEMDWAGKRRAMVEQQLRAIRDHRVLDAMRAVPRHLFVPEAAREASCEDRALPIGHGQTISQPLMVAIMLEAAELAPGDRVLEVGTGSGYQAALLSKLVSCVFTMEIVTALAAMARSNLQAAQIEGVQVIEGDGGGGYPPGAPYDAIIVAAGAPTVPEPLVEQLAPGGRLIVPVGGLPLQVLMRIRKTPEGMTIDELDYCAFVPLVGEHGAQVY